MIGISLAAVGVVIALSQTLMTGPLVRRLGERGAAQLGLIGAGAGFMGYAFCTSTVLAFVLLAAVALQSLVQPSLMAMLSRRASAAAQGEVQGLAAMVMGLGSVLGPLVLVAPMAWFTSPRAPVHFPGAPFLIAVVFAASAFVVLRTTPHQASA